MEKRPETSVLSIRLRKVDREWLAEEAKRSGVPLSELAFNLICQGIEARGKAESPGIQPAAKQPSEKSQPSGKEEGHGIP